MLQQSQTIGNTVSNLTGPRFEPQTSRSRNECVTAQLTGHYYIAKLFTESKKLDNDHKIASFEQQHCCFFAVNLVSSVLKNIASNACFWEYHCSECDQT